MAVQRAGIEQQAAIQFSHMGESAGCAATMGRQGYGANRPQSQAPAAGTPGNRPSLARFHRILCCELAAPLDLVDASGRAGCSALARRKPRA